MKSPKMYIFAFATMFVAGLAAQGQQSFSVVANFPQSVIRPYGGLIAGPNLENSNLRLYGLSEYGGTGGAGVLYSWEPATQTLRVEADFGTDFGPLTPLRSGRVGKGEHRIVAIATGSPAVTSIYGVTVEGGIKGHGIVWKWTPTPVPTPATVVPELVKLVDFDRADVGAFPKYGVVTNGTVLYGTCSEGGTNSLGTVWSLPVAGGAVTVLHNVTARTSTTGVGQLTGGVTVAGSDLVGLSEIQDPATLAVTTTIWTITPGSPGSVVTSRRNVLAAEGSVSGTLASAGSTVYGVFELPSSTSKKIFRWQKNNATEVRVSTNAIASPGKISLSVADSIVYGLAETGSGTGETDGQLFTWNGQADGAITILARMKPIATSASAPSAPAGLIYRDATTQDIYGTSVKGGVNSEGTIWKYTVASAAVTTSKNLNPPGYGGDITGLVSQPNGSVFGTESLGQSVWRWNPVDGLVRLARFTDSVKQGSAPLGQVATNSSGTVFGVTSSGGSNGKGTVWQYTQHSGITPLASLGGTTAPGTPSGGLVADAAGNLYGISNQRVGTGGTTTTLWRIAAGTSTIDTRATFNEATHGSYCIGSLAMDDSGAVYGVCTLGGGLDKEGTLWKWIPGTGLQALSTFDITPSVEIRKPRGGVAVAPDGSAVYGTCGPLPPAQDRSRVWKWTRPTSGTLPVAATRYSTISLTDHGEYIPMPTGLVIDSNPLSISQAAIVLTPNNSLFGMTDRGGGGGLGCGVLWTAEGGSTTPVNLSRARDFRRTECDGGRGQINFTIGADGGVYGATGNALWRQSTGGTLAQPASAITSPASQLTATGLTLNGSVIPNGASTTVSFEYGSSPDSLTQTLTASPSPVTGSAAATVSAQAKFLTPGTDYFYRVKTVNANGTSYGGIAKAKTDPATTPPKLTTLPATPASITHEAATLNGTANANHVTEPASTAFQWGLSDKLLTNLAEATPPTVTGTTVTPISANLTGLAPHTKYFFRSIAAGKQGLGLGTVLNFTTGNRSPLGKVDTASTTPGSPVTIPVLANDTDPDTDVLGVKSFTQPAPGQGKVTKVGSNIVFTPAAGFATTASASFTYVAQDAFGGASGATTVIVTRDTINITPTASPDTLLAAKHTYNIAIDTGLADTSWSAVETSPFVSLNKTTGKGDDTLIVTVEANATKSPRTATIVIGGATHTITQPGVVIPVLIKPTPIPPSIVSGDFSLPLQTSTPSLPAPKYTLAKNPPGLAVTVNPTTGQASVTGKPDKAGPFTVTVTASNAAGSSTTTFDMTVQPFPTYMIGEHTALVSRNPLFNNNLGGLLTFTTSATGTISGALKLGAAKTKPDTLTFTGRLNLAAPTSPALQTAAIALVSIARTSPQSPIDLALAVGGAGDTIFAQDSVAATVSVPGEPGNPSIPSSASGWHNKWTIAAPATVLKDAKGKPLSEYYTVSITPASSQQTVPQGFGYLTFTLQPTGTVAWSMPLADGSLAEGATILSPTNQFIAWYPLYYSASSKKYFGVMSGVVTITRPADTVAATLLWTKATPVPADSKPILSYPGGFDTTLTAMGARYTPPTGIVFGLLPNPAPTALIGFAQGGIGSASQAADMNQNFTITTANKTIFEPTNNTTLINVTFDKTKGLFSGTFSLTDTLGSVVSKRSKIPFKGVLLPDAAMPKNSRGKGFFNLPLLDANGAFATTDRLSGNVTISPQ